METRQAAKAMIFNEKGEFLVFKVQLRNGEEVWDIPGGKLEENESHEDALIREVEEETKLEIGLKEELGDYSFIDKRKDCKVICKAFKCELKNPDISSFENKIEKIDHIEGYEWISIKDFLENEYNATEDFIRFLKDIN